MSDQLSNPHRSDIPRIIGLSGNRPGAGKTTAAGILLEQYGYHLKSFATPLKQAAKLIYALSYEQLYNPDEKDRIDERYGLSPRAILQQLGTEVCRAIDPLTWVLAMERRIDNECAYVIDDVRFPNEVTAIKRWGGVVWEIVRRGSVEDSGHISESHLLDVDRIVYNNSTKGRLETGIRYIMEKES